jgi:hypothetical protein
MRLSGAAERERSQTQFYRWGMSLGASLLAHNDEVGCSDDTVGPGSDDHKADRVTFYQSGICD